MPMSISPPPHAVHPYFNLPLANPISPPPNTRPTHIFNDHQLFPTQHSTYTPPPPFPFQQTLFPPPPPAQPMPDPYRRLPLRYARSRQQQRHASLHDLFILGPSTPGPSPPSHSAADPVPTQPGPSPSSSSSTPSYPQQLAQRPARRFSASDVEVSAETVAEGNRTLCRNLRLRGV
ncbi:hypothetical protein GQ44DRAFT_228913 [Phaeosphaeriaceae sp. PMI808]|nr:hypothetical protein GQ44DRAFT_228913 [Phaeosphaeriaceae sp. PMI808]